MKMSARWATSMAMVLASTAVMLGVAASPASASALCHNYGCMGLDPGNEGCSVSVTSTAYANDPYDGKTVAVIQNRYASNCNSNWARAYLTSDGLARGYFIYADITTLDSQYPRVQEYMCVPTPTGNTGRTPENCGPNPYGGNQVIWSDMVDGTYSTTASVKVYKEGSSNPLVTASANN